MEQAKGNLTRIYIYIMKKKYAPKKAYFSMRFYLNPLYFVSFFSYPNSFILQHCQSIYNILSLDWYRRGIILFEYTHIWWHFKNILNVSAFYQRSTWVHFYFSIQWYLSGSNGFVTSSLCLASIKWAQTGKRTSRRCCNCAFFLMKCA